MLTFKDSKYWEETLRIWWERRWRRRIDIATVAVTRHQVAAKLQLIAIMWEFSWTFCKQIKLVSSRIKEYHWIEDFLSNSPNDDQILYQIFRPHKFKFTQKVKKKFLKLLRILWEKFNLPNNFIKMSFLLNKSIFIVNAFMNMFVLDNEFNREFI